MSVEAKTGLFHAVEAYYISDSTKVNYSIRKVLADERENVIARIRSSNYKLVNTCSPHVGESKVLNKDKLPDLEQCVCVRLIRDPQSLYWKAIIFVFTVKKISLVLLTLSFIWFLCTSYVWSQCTFEVKDSHEKNITCRKIHDISKRKVTGKVSNTAQIINKSTEWQ